MSILEGIEDLNFILSKSNIELASKYIGFLQKCLESELLDDEMILFTLNKISELLIEKQIEVCQK